jgi:cytochrome c biogenesis protein CcdA
MFAAVTASAAAVSAFFLREFGALGIAVLIVMVVFGFASLVGFVGLALERRRRRATDPERRLAEGRNPDALARIAARLQEAE